MSETPLPWPVEGEEDSNEDMGEARHRLDQ